MFWISQTEDNYTVIFVINCLFVIVIFTAKIPNFCWLQLFKLDNIDAFL